MNSSNYRFTLDMQSNQSQVSLPVKLNDTKRKLYITLTDRGTPYIIEDGCRAVFTAEKPDGNALFNDCIIENNSTIRYDFTKQTASVSGKVDCEIRLYDPEGKLLTSPAFIMIVDERVVYDDDVLSEFEGTALDNILVTEKARIEAEAAREKAETERESNVTELIEKVETTVAEWEDAENGRATAEAKREERVSIVETKVASYASFLGAAKGVIPTVYSIVNELMNNEHEDGDMFVCKSGDVTFVTYLEDPVSDAIPFSVDSADWLVGNVTIEPNKAYCFTSLTDGTGKYFVTSDAILPERNVISELEESITSAEEQRQEAETSRVEAEKSRATAENGRVEAEKIRQENAEKYWNALRATSKGEVVRVDDVSPVEHTVECTVHGKNLIDSSRLLLASGWSESNGVYSGDSEKLFNAFGSVSTNRLLVTDFKPNTQYVLSFKGYRSADNTHANAFLFEYDDGTSTRIDITSEVEVTHTLVSTAGKTVVDFRPTYYYSGVTTYLSELQLEEGSEATEYTAYIDPTTVALTKCGKNIAHPNMYTGKVGGYTYSPNEDGSVTISGAATTTSEHIIALALKDAEGNAVGATLKANKTYSLSVTKDGEEFTGFGTKVLLADGTTKWSFDKTATQDRELVLIYVQFTPSAGDTTYCGTYRVQLELADEATDYEPYVGEVYTPNADGTVDGIRSVTPIMTIMTDTEGVTIEIAYNQDINALRNPVISYSDYEKIADKSGIWIVSV